MEVKESVKVSYSYNGLQLSAEGGEDFVQKQIDYFHAKLHENSFPIEQESSEKFANDVVNTDNPYPNVIAMEGKEVRIVKNLTGSKRQKILDIIYVYLWAKSSLGIDSVPLDEIKKICVEDGCYDGKNFAGYLRSQKQILRDGDMIRLTIPAKRHAEVILNRLNSGQ